MFSALWGSTHLRELHLGRWKNANALYPFPQLLLKYLLESRSVAALTTISLRVQDAHQGRAIIRGVKVAESRFPSLRPFKLQILDENGDDLGLDTKAC